MKSFLLAAAIFLAATGPTAASKDPDNDFYKKDIAHFYVKSSAVAHIKITDSKLIKVLRPIDARTGQPIDNFGYRTYKLRFEVVQNFKGSLKNSSSISMTIEGARKPPVGNFIALLSQDKSGSFYFTDDSLFMIPARSELLKFTQSLK